MTDPIRQAAIEAAAKAHAEGDWDRCNPFVVRTYVTPLVDAVLAVVRPAYRAEALRDAADALEDGPWESSEDEGIRTAVHALREQADIEDPS